MIDIIDIIIINCSMNTLAGAVYRQYVHIGVQGLITIFIFVSKYFDYFYIYKL